MPFAVCSVQYAAESNADVPHVRLGGLLDCSNGDCSILDTVRLGLFDCSTLPSSRKRRTDTVSYLYKPFTLSYCRRVINIEEISDSRETSGIFAKCSPPLFGQE